MSGGLEIFIVMLIFLGLLGTFWGLLHTVNEVAKVIGGLSISGEDMAAGFAQLKSGLEAPLGGSVWKMLVQPGDRVEKGAVIAVIEAMKTECEVPSPSAGVDVRATSMRIGHAMKSEYFLTSSLIFHSDV